MSSSQSEILLFARRRRILKIVSGTAALIALISLLYTSYNFWQALSNDKSPGTLTASLAACIVTLLAAGLSFVLARQGKPRSIHLGSYIITGTWALIIFASVLLTSFSASTIATLLLPMLAAGLLFGPREVLGWMIALVGLLTLAFVLIITEIVPMATSSSTATSQNNQSVLYTNFVVFGLLLWVVGSGLWYIQVNVRSVMAEVNSQFEELARLNQEREQQRRVGEKVSVRLNSMTTELNVVAVQQNSLSQQQASAVQEVSASLNELGETTRQIARNAQQVKNEANAGLVKTQQVRETSQHATQTAQRGQVAVASAIDGVEEVERGISNLAERLLVLTERSRQISSIVGLIRDIADQTHLIGLNAAIESAGAGVYGERFGVVAAEVKSLTDRVLKATREVTEVINELQDAVGQAVLASDETRQKTFGAVERSYQAGQVITELGQVVTEAAANSLQIVDAVRQIVTLNTEISLSTGQQENSVRQIIQIMQEVGTVAQETASASSQVSATVTNIDHISAQLKEVLNEVGPLALAA